MGSEGSTTLNRLKKHPRYYLPGGDAYFLVGNQIFRVHKYFLEQESSVFREQFQLPSVSGGPYNGETESAAIVLKDVQPAAFEKLLYMFYNPKYSVYDCSVDDWTTIIKLALKWKLPEVRDLAIRELNKIGIPLISPIVLYQHLNLDHIHLIPLYATLCRRPHALNNQESAAIGLPTTVLIFNARERLRAVPSNDGATSPLPDELEDSDIHATITSLLGGATALST